jgi:hypothetical protein
VKLAISSIAPHHNKSDNLAAKHSDIVSRVEQILKEQRHLSALFPITDPDPAAK